MSDWCGKLTISLSMFDNLALFIYVSTDKQIIELNGDWIKRPNIDKDRYVIGMFMIGRYKLNDMNINIDR